MTTRAALLLLAPLALSACREDPRAGLLSGSWLCTAAPVDYSMAREVTYAEGGDLSGRIEIESTDGETPVAMAFAVDGTWQLDGDVLTETLETHRLMRFARNGDNVPLVELPAGFIGDVEGALAGGATVYMVETLTEQALALRDDVTGVHSTCIRPDAS